MNLTDDISFTTPPPKLARASSWAAETPPQPLRGKLRLVEQMDQSAQPQRKSPRDARRCETQNAWNIQQLPANDPDRLHFLECPLSDNCNRCQFAMKKRTWMSKLLVDAGRPEHGTWVRSEVVNGVWGLRCQSCRAAGVRSLFTTSGLGDSAPALRFSTLLNHAKSKSHLSAVCRDDEEPLAPTKEHFLDVLHAVRDGKSDGDKGVRNIGKRWKIRRMKFCLAEAKRVLMRSALAKAKVIALHQDCRKGMLAVRYVSVDSNLQVSKGVLGCLNLKECDALGLRDATIKIVHDACVPFHHAPSKMAVKRNGFEANVFDTIVKGIELFDADAASDETLAGRLLRGIRPGSSDESEFTSAFPNLKICNRDKPHGARRTPQQNERSARKNMTWPAGSPPPLQLTSA